MMKPFAFRSSNTNDDKRAIKFINDNLQNRLIDNVNITVTEIECNQPNCAPIEVLIILITESEKWAGKILKPLIEVTIDDIIDVDIPQSMCKSKVPMWVKELATEFKVKSIELSDNEYRDSISYLKDFLDDVSYRNSKEELQVSTKEDDISKMNETTANNNIVSVQMVPKETIAEKVIPPPPVRLKTVSASSFDAPIRHNKGVRPRGCPCCDPDAADILLNFNGSI